jgi:hypothetical protein
VCKTGNRWNIDNFDEWIGRCFKENEGGIFVEERFDCFDICCIDMVNGNPVMR